MEKEVKFKVIMDPKVLEEELSRDGFARIATCLEEDLYFDTAGRRLSSSDQALRLRRRKCNGVVSVRLTYKGPRLKGIEGGVKIREEVELEVKPEEHAQAVSLLRSLGFNDEWRLFKKRVLMVKKGLEASIDYFEPLGVFLEIEVKDEDAMMEFERLVEKYSKTFPVIGETYLEMYVKHLENKERV
ncbi:class IV adenylate cyclase [Thermosphaera chiliense]|uniref:Class IV adenylate cyclase n=1 Tax=Thermosphaera chiliense TaxID=3402707 RepID=A0A7M1UTY7_9CREN|nr:class IV adenylate cyclase [Thermosphaera aggregans]QOR94364.1 class IV adenylate cyclase [Thermosphaera aggregans]